MLNKAVNVFHNRCLRKILRIRWQDRVSTKELLERAGMKPLSVEVMSRRWEMIGHIRRKDRNDDNDVQEVVSSQPSVTCYKSTNQKLRIRTVYKI